MIFDDAVLKAFVWGENTKGQLGLGDTRLVVVCCKFCRHYESPFSLKVSLTRIPCFGIQK